MQIQVKQKRVIKINFTRPVQYFSLEMLKYLTKNPLELVHVPYSPLPTRYEDYHRRPY